MKQVAGRFAAPPVILGHSMGGFLTQKYQEAHHPHPAAGRDVDEHIHLLRKYYPGLQDESFRSYPDETGLNQVQSKHVKTPLLVIGRENDRIIPPQMVMSAAKAYGTQAIFFPGMAQDLILETGWTAVAEKILN